MLSRMSSHFRSPRPPHVSPGQADLHAADMTATFAADVTLADAQTRLASIDQWLPLDGDPDATLGELVDTNSTGPLRLGYGAWRDLLLGVQFTNGRGELITAGGRTVKNVAGYDLTKLMVGQRGVFGRLVTITTRVYRRPVGAIHAVFDLKADLLPQLLTTPLRPQWAMGTPDALTLGYLGDESTLAYYAAVLPTTNARQIQPRQLLQDIEHRRSRWCFGGTLTFRASVPPAKVADFVTAAGATAWSADPVFGIVVGDVSPTGVDTLTSAARAVSGTAMVVDRSTHPHRVAASPVGLVEQTVIARLKSAFDPDNALERVQ